MTRTYVDAGVLIDFTRRDTTRSTEIGLVLLDPDRDFVSSTYLRLEVLPKALFHRRDNEARLYHWYFARVAAWADASPRLTEQAEDLAARYGLAALDALHLAAALSLNADELLTTEGPAKPLHRAIGVAVVRV